MKGRELKERNSANKARIEGLKRLNKAPLYPTLAVWPAAAQLAKSVSEAMFVGRGFKQTEASKQKEKEQMEKAMRERREREAAFSPQGSPASSPRSPKLRKQQSAHFEDLKKKKEKN